MFGAKTVPTETPQQIAAAMERGEVALIDVREAGEHASARIAGAHLHPLSRFDPAALPRGKALVLHCGSGKRSATAFVQCRKAGVDVRSHMGGGIQAWKAAGLPVAGGDR